MTDISPDVEPETPVEPTLLDEGTWSEQDRELLEIFQAAAGAPDEDDEPEAPAAVEPEPDPEPETPAEPERIIPVADDQTISFGDFSIDKTQAEQQLRWLASLSPAQQAALTTPPAAEDAAPAGSPAPVGAAPALPDLAVLGEIAPDLPAFLQSVASTQREQQEQWAAFQAEQARNAHALAEADRTRTQAAIEDADRAFKAAHPELHPDDIEHLARLGHRMQVFPALVQQHRGDIGAAYTDLLDTAMWKDPRFRDRALQAAVDQHSTQSREAESRRDRAAALTGSGGSMPRTPETPNTRGMDRAQLNEVIAAELAQHQQQQ